MELAGASSGASALTLAQFTQFCEAAQPWGEADQVREFVEAGLKRRAWLDPFDPARIEEAFRAIDLDDVRHMWPLKRMCCELHLTDASPVAAVGFY